MRPTLFTANWTDIAAFNYPVDPAILKPYVPPDLKLDKFEGRTFLSMIALRFGDCSFLGAMPFFMQPTFPMIAFRTYVKRKDQDGVVRRGTIFLKEIARHQSVKTTARLLGKTEFHQAPVTSNISVGSNYHFRWGRIAENNWLEASVDSLPHVTEPGTLEDFIFENQWDFVPLKGHGTLQYRVRHPRWNVWHARKAEAHINLQGILPQEIAAALSEPPSTVMVAEGSKVRVEFPSLARRQWRIAPSPQLYRLS